MLDDELDRWLARPTVRTRHSRSAAAPPEVLYAAAAGVRLDQTRTLGRLVRWRIPGTDGSRTFSEVLSTYPFTVLASGESWSVSGLVGRIWTLQRDYPRLRDAEEFRAWDAPGTVRVLMAHWVEGGEDGRSTFFSEARVKPVDRGAALRLRSLWAVVGHFERLIGAEPLRIAAAAAAEPGAPPRTGAARAPADAG